jgi:MFS transporter, ACDE family, multidrug resistance protein
MSRRPPLAFIFAVTLTGILNNTLLSPAIPDILDEFEVSSDQAGWLVSLGSVAGIVIAPVVGILADRYGRRIVLSACLAVFGAAGGIAALAPTFGFLLGARFIQGFGSAGLVNLAIVLIGDHWSGLDRTRLIGRNAAVLTTGLAAVPLLSGAVTQAAGWRVAFVVYTVGLVMSGIAWLVLDNWRPSEPPKLRNQVSGVAEVVVRPEIRVLLVAAFLVFVMIFGLFLTVFPVHLAEKFGMEAGARGVMIAVPAIGSTLLAFNLGRIRAVLSTRSLVILAGVGFTIAFVTIGLAALVVLVVMAAVVYGASEGAMIPALQDQAMEGSPDEHRGGVMAVWVSMSRTGQTVGPILAGAALAVWSTGTVFIVGSLVAVSIAVLGILGPLSRLRAEAPSPSR